MWPLLAQRFRVTALCMHHVLVVALPLYTVYTMSSGLNVCRIVAVTERFSHRHLSRRKHLSRAQLHCFDTNTQTTKKLHFKLSRLILWGKQVSYCTCVMCIINKVMDFVAMAATKYTNIHIYNIHIYTLYIYGVTVSYIGPVLVERCYRDYLTIFYLLLLLTD